MRIRALALLVVLTLVAACGDRDREPEETPPADTAGAGPAAEGTAPGGGAAARETAATTTGGRATTASSPEETGAPMPPEGYAVDSRPASAEGGLARIEYATPRTVGEAAEFYDSQMRVARRVEIELPGDNLVVYALSPSTTITAATTVQDVERLLEARSEPILVVSPWKMVRDDPLIRDLRQIGQNAQADALLLTRSKVTVVYSVR